MTPVFIKTFNVVEDIIAASGAYCLPSSEVKIENMTKICINTTQSRSAAGL